MILSKEELRELKTVKITKKKVLLVLFLPTSLTLFALIAYTYGALIGKGLPTFKDIFMVIATFLGLTFAGSFAMFIFEIYRIRFKITMKDRETRRFALVYYAIIIILVILASKLKK